MNFIYKDISETDDVSKMISDVSNNIKTINSLICELKKLRLSSLKNNENSDICNEKEVLVDNIEIEDDDVDDFMDEIFYYYSQVKNIRLDGDDIFELNDVLPSAVNSRYQEIVLGINVFLMKEINEIREFIERDKEELSLEYLNEFRNEILSIKKKIDAINEISSGNKEQSSLVEDEVKLNKIVFLETTSGNIYALDDLDSNRVPLDYYDGFLELISSIEDGTFKNVKTLVSNNSKTAGISEVKGFKKRVIFDRVGSDVYVIIGVFIKKSDKDKSYLEPLKNRIAVYRRNRDYIVSMIQDKEYLDSQKNILDEVYTLLNSNKKKKGV